MGRDEHRCAEVLGERLRQSTRQQVGDLRLPPLIVMIHSMRGNQEERARPEDVDHEFWAAVISVSCVARLSTEPLRRGQHGTGATRRSGGRMTT